MSNEFSPNSSFSVYQNENLEILTLSNIKESCRESLEWKQVIKHRFALKSDFCLNSI